MASRNEKRMMASACRFAYCRFALNSYLFYEELREDEKVSKKQDEFQKQFLELLGSFLEGDYPVEKLDQFRNQIIREVEIITAYVDYFERFEYMLNRMEFRYQAPPAAVEDEQFVGSVMHYILSGEDNALINERIKSVLGQLPIRFTKAKFLSILSQAMSVYEGAGRESLEQFIDLLRSEALLKQPEDMAKDHEELQELLKALQEGNFKDPSREEWKKLQDCFRIGREILSKASSDSMTMIDLVNDLYVICLTKKDVPMDLQEEELFRKLLSCVWEKAGKGSDSDEEDMMEYLVEMEGKQEQYYEEYSRYEAEAVKASGAGDETEEYETLQKISSLLSTSSFMTLETEKEPEEAEILLSKKAVEEMCRQFFDELEASWKSMPKQLVRSIMARLLEVIPLFFLSLDELQEFIGGCLSSCTDYSEKAASIQLIQSMMESDYAMV